MSAQVENAELLYTPAQESADIRQSMTAVPKVLDLPLTLLTGKPSAGQKTPRLTPNTHVIGAAASMAVGLTASWFAFAAGRWWYLALPFTCAVTMHGMRNARMMLYHQSAHRNLWARKLPDRVLGRVVAGLLMIQDFDRYSSEHVVDHHAVHHMTVRDPTVQAFLISLGLTPGMSRREMWRRVNRKITSPVYHARFLSGRIQSYFRPAPWSVRIGTAAAFAAAAALITWAGQWPFALICWVLPLTVPYQVSNTLRLCVKHTFPQPGATVRRGKEHFAGLTNAIFLGERAPEKGLKAWTRWWIRMLLVHAPARYLVLTGDTVVHDYHHRHPMSRRWAGYIFERQADVDAGHPGWPEYREVWGLIPAINVVFESLSRADPDEYRRDRIGPVTGRDLFSAFDD